MTDNLAATTPADVVMSDGRIAVIRQLESGDRAALQSLHDDVSDDAFRLRFFTAGRASGHAYVEHLFASGDAICLVAILNDRIVAAATAEPLDPTSAEIAFLVADSERGLGLGSLLVEHLTARCRDAGIDRLVAEVLWENRLMLEVFDNAGFGCTRTDEGDMVRLDMLTEMSPESLTAADSREAQAESRSLAATLHPQVVAVVGVKSDGTGIGHAVLVSVKQGGFTGTLTLVHPVLTSMEGVPAYRHLTEIPAQVDLAIIAVPAEHVLEVLRDAIRANVRGVVVISSGFSEMDAAGKEAQRAIVRLARDNGIRLIGPNCLGILINDPAVRLNATFTRSQPPPGGLALASQSGGVGIVLLDTATALGLGVHTFISLGNKADVSGNDLLSAWLNDPSVTAAALYLESFGNPRKFARIAYRFSRAKPLLAVVGGRSLGGRRAGRSHTGAAAPSSAGTAALLARAGVISCRGTEDLSATALLLASEPLPQGPRVGIISNAGGIAVLAADAADDAGLIVPAFSAGLQATMTSFVSGTVGISNPVDIGAGGSAVALEASAEAVLASGEVDAVVVVVVATVLTDTERVLAALAAARTMHLDVPLLVVMMGAQEPATPAHPNLTIFRNYQVALEALSRAAARAQWLALPEAQTIVPESRALDIDRARAVRQQALALLAGSEAPGCLIPTALSLFRNRKPGSSSPSVSSATPCSAP
jgi:acyl-CoA synthetase (NDP forming)/GNAT superfamily N-acetyltransferase